MKMSHGGGREGAGARQHGWATPWRQPCLQAPLFWPRAAVFVIVPWSLAFCMDRSWRTLQFDRIELGSRSLPSSEPRGGRGRVSWPWLYQKTSPVPGPDFGATLGAEKKNQTLNMVQKTMEQVWLLGPLRWIAGWCHGAAPHRGWGLPVKSLWLFLVCLSLVRVSLPNRNWTVI